MCLFEDENIEKFLKYLPCFICLKALFKLYFMIERVLHVWVVRIVTVYLVQNVSQCETESSEDDEGCIKTFFGIIRLKLTIICTLSCERIGLEVAQKSTLRQSRIKCSTFNKRH